MTAPSVGLISDLFMKQGPKYTHHREVDIAGIELHIDLFVDESLGLLVVVHADLAGRHLELGVKTDRVWWMFI